MKKKTTSIKRKYELGGSLDVNLDKGKKSKKQVQKNNKKYPTSPPAPNPDQLPTDVMKRGGVVKSSKSKIGYGKR